MWPKWTVRRPTPMPRSGRSQRLDIGVARDLPGRQGARAGRGHGRHAPVAPRSRWTYFFFSSFFTGTPQPPLPLQEFLPAHPLSPVLQPPWPLHSFLPLQPCLATVAQPPLPLQEFFPAQPPLPLHEFMPLHACFSFVSAFFSSADSRDPAAMPATTAPMIFVNSLRSMLGLLGTLGTSLGLQNGSADGLIPVFAKRHHGRSIEWVRLPVMHPLPDLCQRSTANRQTALWPGCVARGRAVSCSRFRISIQPLGSKRAAPATAPSELHGAQRGSSLGALAPRLLKKGSVFLNLPKSSVQRLSDN